MAESMVTVEVRIADRKQFMDLLDVFMEHRALMPHEAIEALDAFIEDRASGGWSEYEANVRYQGWLETIRRR